MDMSMGGMDMSGMGGMDQASAGLFTQKNEGIAHGYWYAVAGCVGALGVLRAASWYESRRRQSSHARDSRIVPSRPTGFLSQTWATATATLRELSYPQPIWFSGRFSKYFSPLPVGKWVLLAIYWAVILTMLWSNAILSPGSSMYAYKWEKVGFRAAWVSVTQIPFVYLLSCKFNPISIITGVSYERFNWLHRWAARTVFLTVIVHWAYFFREWWLADFVTLEMGMMPMVKYGFGAWAVIGWMVITGFGFFRAMNYELWVAQHILAFAVLLWLVYVHVPTYARYNVWLSVGFVVFDWGARGVWALLRNFHILGKPVSKAPGYSTSAETLPGDMVRLTLENVDFEWKAGQHVYLYIPALGPLQTHPFTIANASHSRSDLQGRQLTMMIKAHSGFSRTLYKAAEKGTVNGFKGRAFVSGPWGIPPDLLHYETVVLIASSSGASFTVPLLQDLVKRKGCVQKIHFHWIVRSQDHFEWFSRDILDPIEMARTASLQLQVTVHVTQDAGSDLPSYPEELKQMADPTTVSVGSASSSSSASISSAEREKSALFLSQRPSVGSATAMLSMRNGSRPTVESMIRSPVEAAVGETAVVTCGGLSITAQARTFVASLSDERAVHKGSGAQGIYLFTETYGW